MSERAEEPLVDEVVKVEASPETDWNDLIIVDKTKADQKPVVAKMVKEPRAQEVEATSQIEIATAITKFAEEIKDVIDKCCQKAIEGEEEK